ncbi:MAG: L-threonylcarbamoyladenylate synthase [Candidatus Buchananbacteria bacterium]
MYIGKINSSNLALAIKTLKKHGVIVYPTDTAYALGGIFNSRKVIKKILGIKNRQDQKFTLIASSQNQVEKFFKLNRLEKKIVKKYWPGPLSLVVSEKFAVRVPKNKIAQTLARRVGQPLIATSANLTGQPTPYNDQVVIKEFKNKKNQPDLILSAGRLKNIKTSTIIKVSEDKVKILRLGAIKF